MHATPGPSGPDQSPLAAETFLRQAPTRVGLLHSEEEEGARSTYRAQGSAPLQPQAWRAFPRLNASRPDKIRPHGPWAPIWASLRLVTRAQPRGLLRYAIYPWSSGPTRAPQAKARALKPGAGPFSSGDFPGILTFFSRILATRNLARYREGKLHGQTRYAGNPCAVWPRSASQPAAANRWDPWNYTQEARIQDAWIRRAVIALWHTDVT